MQEILRRKMQNFRSPVLAILTFDVRIAKFSEAVFHVVCGCFQIGHTPAPAASTHEVFIKDNAVFVKKATFFVTSA